ncbi:MAG: TonB-dependent receptor, partial [Acidobacteriota bacterium]
VVKELGIQGVNPQGLSAAGFPRMSITGYPALTLPPGGVNPNDFDWGYADTVTWSKGRHVVKFGGEFKPKNLFVGRVPTGAYGDFSFDGRFTGYGFGDFLLGYPSSSSRLDPLTNRWRDDSEFGVFITDDFKLSNRVTLNLGLRWDRFGSPSFRDGLMWNWDISTGKIVIPTGTENKVRPLYPKNITIVTGQVRRNPDMTNFAPRLGVAWRPFGENTVIRGGYGLYTEYLGRFARLNTGGPFEISETYINEIRDGKPLFALPNPFPPSIAGATVPSQSFTGYPLETKNGQTHQFNLTLERQVHDVGFRLSYVGSRSRNVNYSLGINKPAPSLIPFTASRRPWPQFVGGSYFRTDGARNFNALTLQAQRKLGSLTLDAHWTWASNYNNMVDLTDPYARPGWGRDPYTTRNRAVMNAVWEIPVGKGRPYLSAAPAVVNHALGGWQLYWIAYFESGWYFTPSFSGSDPSNTNTSGGRPDRVCNGNLPLGERGINRWFDASCFVAPPAGAGRYGNAGTNFLEGPGYHMHHISLAKTFNLTERWKFTFTAAGANGFNHANFSRPSANISAPGSVGVVSGLRAGATARRIELRGRIDF